MDAIETDPLIYTWRIKPHVALHGIFHWAAKNFAIWNVAVATADNGRNSLDTKTQIGAGIFDFDTVRFFH